MSKDTPQTEADLQDIAGYIRKTSTSAIAFTIGISADEAEVLVLKVPEIKAWRDRLSLETIDGIRP